MQKLRQSLLQSLHYGPSPNFHVARHVMGLGDSAGDELGRGKVKYQMAIDFDPSLLRWSRSIRNWRGLWRHYSSPMVGFYRRTRRKQMVSNASHVSRSSDPARLHSSTRFTVEGDFQKNGWAYIPEFFNHATHQRILAAWPDLCWFNPPRSSFEKSYDIFGGWASHRKDRLKFIDPCIYETFELLFSESTARLVTDLARDNTERTAANASLSWARHGSYLLPHRDSNSEGDGSWINFIIFVDGLTPALQSGGTSFFITNRYDRPIFVPTTLRNSAIVYDTRRGFYHGFPPVGRGKFSKRIICNYASLSEIRNSSAP